MPDAEAAAAARAAEQSRVSELKVSGNLMNLDAGLFCIVLAPARVTDAASGLPGVRVSLPPGASAAGSVAISTFRGDGWLGAGGDAALVRVSGGPAQVLITVYQSAGSSDSAPSLQVMRLIEAGAGGEIAPHASSAANAAVPGAERRVPEVMDLVAHIQGRGDTGGRIGEWLGTVGSKAWIEGFAIAPTRDVAPEDIEYQAVLGRGWLSPWVEGGQYCGSRGMALPVLGLRIRLRGKAADAYECSYSASFIDGTQAGPVAAGEACEADSLAAMEAFRITLQRKGTASPPPAKAASSRASRARAR